MTLLRLLATACLVLPGTALAGDIVVEAPFALISPAGQSGAAFMRLENPGTTDDRLVGAASDIAARVELHTHSEDSAGVMRMLEVEDGFPIPAGGAHMLERGGDHVMFLGLTRVPEEGESVALTLTFESGAEIALEIPVGAPAGAPDHGHSHGHGHSHSHGD